MVKVMVVYCRFVNSRFVDSQFVYTLNIKTSYSRLTKPQTVILNAKLGIDELGVDKPRTPRDGDGGSGVWWYVEEPGEETRGGGGGGLTEMPHLILCATINTFQVYTTLSYIMLELVERSVQQLKTTNKQTNKQQTNKQTTTILIITNMYIHSIHENPLTTVLICAHRHGYK